MFLHILALNQFFLFLVCFHPLLLPIRHLHAAEVMPGPDHAAMAYIPINKTI
jgi:hypothetical protein